MYTKLESTKCMSHLKRSGPAYGSGTHSTTETNTRALVLAPAMDVLCLLILEYTIYRPLNTQ